MPNNSNGPNGPPDNAGVWINGSQRAVEVISERFERNGKTRHVVYETPADRPTAGAGGPS